MIAIVDYGVGNLFSLKSSLSMIGASALVTLRTKLAPIWMIAVGAALGAAGFV